MTETAEMPVLDKGTKVGLESLRQTCLTREAQFYDDMVSLKSLSMDEQTPGRLLIKRGKDTPTESYGMLDHLYSQAPSVVYGLPGGLLSKLVGSKEYADPALAAQVFNHFVKCNKDKEIMLRFTRGSDEPYLRAMLPGSWNPIPYDQVIEALIGKHGKDVEVTIESFDEKGITFNLITGAIDLNQFKDGGHNMINKEVEWGMRFTDSDVGIGKLQLTPYTLTLVCTNGMTTTGNGAAVGISHSTKAAGEINEVLASIRQGMEMITGYSRQIVGQMEKADNIALDEDALEEVINKINKRFDVTKLENRYVNEAWALEAGNHPNPTVLRLANSFTRAANAEELKVDSRFRLQGVGGSVLELADTSYRWN